MPLITPHDIPDEDEVEMSLVFHANLVEKLFEEVLKPGLFSQRVKSRLLGEGVGRIRSLHRTIGHFHNRHMRCLPQPLSAWKKRPR
jgi:hypothetical protein